MADIPPDGCTLLFAYGTLRSGEGLHRIIEGSVVDSEKIILEGYLMYDDGRGYPLLLKGDEGDFVVGELFVLRDPEGMLLRRLDEVEGAGEEIPIGRRLYRREKIEIRPGMFTWIYLYNKRVREGARVVRDWSKRGAGKNSGASD